MANFLFTIHIHVFRCSKQGCQNVVHYCYWSVACEREQREIVQNNFEIVLGNSRDLDKFLDIFKKNKLDVLTIKQKFKFACRLRDKSGAKNGLLLLRRVASCTAQLQIITLNDLPALTRDGILSKRGVCGTAWINLQPKTIFVFGEMISEENNSTDVDSSDDTVEKTEIAIIKRGRGRPKKSVQTGGAR